MAEQGATITIINFPNMSPVELLSQVPLWGCTTPDAAPCTSTTAESSQMPCPSTSAGPVVRYQQAPLSRASGQHTSVRLLSSEDSSKTETVLQVDLPSERPRTPPDGAELNTLLKQELKESETLSPKPKFSAFQWSLIAISWIVSMCGFILFLTFLGLAYSGYPNFLNFRKFYIFTCVNAIVSLLSAAFFFSRIRKVL